MAPMTATTPVTSLLAAQYRALVIAAPRDSQGAPVDDGEQHPAEGEVDRHPGQGEGRRGEVVTDAQRLGQCDENRLEGDEGGDERSSFGQAVQSQGCPPRGDEAPQQEQPDGEEQCKHDGVRRAPDCPCAPTRSAAHACAETTAPGALVPAPPGRCATTRWRGCRRSPVRGRRCAHHALSAARRRPAGVGSACRRSAPRATSEPIARRRTCRRTASRRTATRPAPHHRHWRRAGTGRRRSPDVPGRPRPCR